MLCSWLIVSHCVNEYEHRRNIGGGRIKVYVLVERKVEENKLLWMCGW
jgi:hypothetical protein